MIPTWRREAGCSMSNPKNAPERLWLRPKGGADGLEGGWADPFVPTGERKPDDAEYVRADLCDAQREELERLRVEVFRYRELLKGARAHASNLAESLWTICEDYAPANTAQEEDDDA